MKDYRPVKSNHISLKFVILLLLSLAAGAYFGADYFRGTLQPTGYMKVGW